MGWWADCGCVRDAETDEILVPCREHEEEEMRGMLQCTQDD